MCRAKYPLAVVDKLLDVLQCSLGMGYDIGCEFITTINNSPLGAKAKRLGYQSLVGLFHGHAHNRLCQTKNLGTYVKDVGLEDFEGNERFYSVCNELAASLRHASTFHRRQALADFARHRDTFDTYPNVSKFMVDNYKQAMDIIAAAPSLVQTMESLGISSTSDFPQFLKEEREYLLSRKKVPEEETLQMEYYRKLGDLKNAE